MATNNTKQTNQEEDKKKKKRVIPFWWWIIGAAVLVGGTIGGLAAGGIFKAGGTSGGEGGEVEPEPIPDGRDPGPMDITQYVHSFNGLETICSDPDNYNVIVGDWINVQLKHQDKDNGVGGLVIDEDGDGFLANGDCYQQIQIIGFNHKNQSTDANPEGVCTFEFKTLLSDENGYSLATYWQDTATTTDSNYNYLDSSIRSALNGASTGSTEPINWFQFFGTGKDSTDNKHFSPNYSDYSDDVQKNNGKSVLSMLPDGLVSAIKPVTKKVNTSEGSGYTETDCTDKLFLLSPLEMGYSASNMETGVTTYKYYEGHTQQTEAIRIKQQVKGTDGARTSKLSGGDLDGHYTFTNSYTGYNSGTTGEGGFSWLRSPKTHNSDDAWYVCANGYISSGAVYVYALAVAPAFCI